MKALQKTVWALLLALAGCAADQTDPAAAGQEFCACMKAHRAREDHALAYRVCDAAMIGKYRYYRLLNFYNRDDTYNGRFSAEQKDSARVYILAFMDYVAANCCEERPPCREPEPPPK